MLLRFYRACQAIHALELVMRNNPTRSYWRNLPIMGTCLQITVSPQTAATWDICELRDRKLCNRDSTTFFLSQLWIHWWLVTVGLREMPRDVDRNIIWFLYSGPESCNVTEAKLQRPKQYFDRHGGIDSDNFWTLQWRHNGRDSVCDHQPRESLLNRLFRRRSKKTSKLRVTGLCAGNSLGTG